jgi:hypothetical protein
VLQINLKKNSNMLAQAIANEEAPKEAATFLLRPSTGAKKRGTEDGYLNAREKMDQNISKLVSEP